MKRITLLLFLGLWVTGIWAQNNTSFKARITTPSKAINKNGFSIQMGMPYLGRNTNNPNTTTNRPTEVLDVRFPWNVCYLPNTFNESSFDVSKGYYGDKILVNWDLIANSELISTIKIYRREVNEANVDDIANFIPKASLASTATQYEDLTAEIGKLYQYKVVAQPLSDGVETKYLNYITGIGYRNPTGIVTGRISYEGATNNPVQNVTVTATSEKDDLLSGASLNIPASGKIKIDTISDPVKTEITFQAWVKPKNAYTDNTGNPIQLLRLSNGSNHIDVTTQLQANAKTLLVKIGNSEYQIHDWFPSGALNNRGDDKMDSIKKFNSQFVHFSVVIKDEAIPLLYINGRPMTTVYKNAINTKLGTVDPNYSAPYFNVTMPTTNNSLKVGEKIVSWDAMDIGGGYDSYMDEIRIWKAELTPETIKTDYKRYIVGDEPNLISYLRANEQAGQYAYDLSRTGDYAYHKNHGLLYETATPNADRITWAKDVNNRPTPEQLGILGITDQNGNYKISCIPYSNGQIFKITPMYGQHKFSPPQASISLGSTTPIINNTNFIDQSNFSFKGVALYDSRGVFPSFVTIDQKLPSNEGQSWIPGPGILDEGYNYYEKNGIKYPKGEYWLNNNNTPNNADDDYLDRYARIYLQGANVYIDGQMVMDQNYSPVVTDDEGRFNINVPIGNHFIQVKKNENIKENEHTLTYNGRFPASGNKEFFEDSEEAVVFLDTTKVTVVGKVVGGPVEAAKKIGFGENGLVTRQVTDSTGVSSLIEVSAKNNIGQAQLILGYDPPIGGITPYTKTTFNTHLTSGEYRVNLLPLQYQLKAEDLTIPKNASLSILRTGTTETLNFSEITSTITPRDTITGYVGGDIFLVGTPYNYAKNFIYRTTPVAKVINQTSAPSIKVADNKGIITDVATTGFPTLFYNQFLEYKIDIECYEEYVNKDYTADIISKVPSTDGTLMMTNNLALPNSEETVRDANNTSIINYKFRAGAPKISPDFTLTSTLKYRINAVDYNVTDFRNTGIILGSVGTTGQKNFLTSISDEPTIILRDPPGSNSNTILAQGQTVTLTTEMTIGTGVDGEGSTVLKNGSDVDSGGFTIPIIKTRIISDSEMGATIQYTSEDGNDLTKTYTIERLVQTNPDATHVGSGVDLFIGTGENIYYSPIKTVFVRDSIPTKYQNNQTIALPNNEYSTFVVNNITYYISAKDEAAIITEPTSTHFVRSQNDIITDVIPTYENFINQINAGTLNPGKENVLTVDDYKTKIFKWRKIILDNEIDKYLAKNYSDKLLENLIYDLEHSKTTEGYTTLHSPYDVVTYDPAMTAKKKLIDDNFKINYSYDSGADRDNKTIETAVLNRTSHSVEIKNEEFLKLVMGGHINGHGVLIKINTKTRQSNKTTNSQSLLEKTAYTTSYRDDDFGNQLSYDVVNLFDGNSPVYITKGGITSCPWEQQVSSHFFTEAEFKDFADQLFLKKDSIRIVRAKIKDIMANFGNDPSGLHTVQEMKDRDIPRIRQNIDKLRDRFYDKLKLLTPTSTQKAALNTATKNCALRTITVENANLTNIPEDGLAEFKLTLTNISPAETKALRNNDLQLLNNEALSGAVFVDDVVENKPYGYAATSRVGIELVYNKPQTISIFLKKLSEDKFDFDNIKVALVHDRDYFLRQQDNPEYPFVTLSAHFIPSCSKVKVSEPLNNWVYNREAAYKWNEVTRTYATKPLNIKINEFNTNFKNFKKIDLEYRLATASNWTRLKTYYKGTADDPDIGQDPDFYDQAVTDLESSIEAIGSNTTLTYAFDIATLKLSNGQYEIRARSTCSNGTEFISPVITGIVDLEAPILFGTPQPTDGILGVGENLTIRFNEPISLDSAVSTVQIIGQTNQLEIDHNVSLHFEGTANTAVIQTPQIPSGDIAIEFWMYNNTPSTATATILKQRDGLEIGLNNGKIYFQLTDTNTKVEREIQSSTLFHHYTFTYNSATGSISIYDDAEGTDFSSKAISTNLSFANSNPIVIGGNTFVGNIHDLRIWSKWISKPDAVAKMYTRFTGNEANLVSLWPMDEGKGALANDKAKFKNATINAASWDIKPKGSSYEFKNNQYLTLESVGTTVVTKEMDATLSFWMKTRTTQEATIFSNGKGDGTDFMQPGQDDNNWAVNINNSGNLVFLSKGTSYTLTANSLTDDQWHHITLLFNRRGSLITYIDAQNVSTNPINNIGGFAGNKIWIGARGYQNPEGIETVDRQFTGKIDELQLWNTLRNTEQISRDRFNEMDQNSIGLLLYAQMNEPESATANGPRYYTRNSLGVSIPNNALLNTVRLNYSNDAPSIKPKRALTNFVVTSVTNGDTMILTPNVTNWASIEGQVLDITVDKMYDSTGNKQQSPVTWTTYVQRNPVSWSADGYNNGIVDIVNTIGTNKSFTITLVNRGGTPQTYAINNIPNWLTLSRSSGTLAPSSTSTITATLNQNVNPGEYIENLNLQTDYGFDQKMLIKLKALEQPPIWSVNPNAFTKNMTITGKLKVNGVFSEDIYDKIVAFCDGQVRGVADLRHLSASNEYFVFLTVYSNNPLPAESFNFKIWDATQGKTLLATLTHPISIPTKSSSINFETSGVIGTIKTPSIFENSNIIEQVIDLNQGETWVSFNVNDSNFTNINALTSKLNLTNGNKIEAQNGLFETYDYRYEGWSGKLSLSISNGGDGGLYNTKMYRITLDSAQKLTIQGSPVDITQWNFPIAIGWNWLPYPLPSYQTIDEALSGFNATDGDVIKSQHGVFAQYATEKGGWYGSLFYLEPGKGYELLSNKTTGDFMYPSYLGTTSTAAKMSLKNANVSKQPEINSEFKKYPENMSAVVVLPEGYNKVFVYDEKGVLKGAAENQTVNEKKFSFISIYGENPETLTFFVGDGENMKKTNKKVSFKVDEVLGTISKPFLLEIEEELSDEIKTFPIPFEKELTITANISSNQTVKLELYSMLGQLLYTKIVKAQSGKNVFQIEPDVLNGVYFLQIEMDGKTTTRKVIKD